jgi:cobalt-zinc-cadmium efflux system membrane fusion protein
MKRLPKLAWGLIIGLAFGTTLGGGVVYVAMGRPGAPGASREPVASGAHDDHEGHDEGEHDEEGHAPGLVELAREKWTPAGLEIAPAQRDSLALVQTVTGKVTANEDRLAHIYSLVEGIVHEVPIRYGDRVKAGDELALIDSREVGQAKLALVEARQDVRIAAVNQEWAETIHRNVQALITDLEAEPSVQEVIGRFEGRPMGEYREQLLSSYAQMLQARAENERDQNLFQRNVLSEKDYLRTKAVYESALAKFKGLMEQIEFTSEQELIRARQAFEQAQVAEGSARSALMILGYGEREVAAMDPLGEGEEVAHYTLKAPFAGTITEKDVVIDERVGSDTKLFDLADLSTVWVQADIYEKDLSLLASLRGRTIRFRTDAYPDRTFEAEVFYSGDIVDPQTRTVRLMAVTDNADGLLKPGQFATIELPVEAAEDVLQVPSTALQEDRDETYVFVHREGELFERRDVRVGRRVPERAAEILAGLEPGEPVVVSGAFALKSAMLGEALGEAGHAH